MNLSPSPTPPVVVPVSLHELISQLGSQPGGPRGGHGEVSESQSPPPSHLLPLAPTDTASLSAKNQLKQPESLSERLALCAWGSEEGAIRFPLSRPSPPKS